MWSASHVLRWFVEQGGGDFEFREGERHPPTLSTLRVTLSDEEFVFDLPGRLVTGVDVGNALAWIYERAQGPVPEPARNLYERWYRRGLSVIAGLLRIEPNGEGIVQILSPERTDTGGIWVRRVLDVSAIEVDIPPDKWVPLGVLNALDECYKQAISKDPLVFWAPGSPAGFGDPAPAGPLEKDPTWGIYNF